MKSNDLLSLVPVAVLAALFATGCGRSESTGVAAAVPAAVAATPGDAIAGEAVYVRVCLACHQFNGLGLPPAFPPLADSAIVAAADPGRIIRIVLHGLQGPIEVNGIPYNSVMPPPVPPLTDKEVADVLTYVRSEWGSEAAPVTVEAVTAIRTQAERPTPWTWAELERL
jgi:nitrite reductase (NO-forming)